MRIRSGVSGHATMSWTCSKRALPRNAICSAMCIVQFVPLLKYEQTKTSAAEGSYGGNVPSTRVIPRLNMSGQRREKSFDIGQTTSQNIGVIATRRQVEYVRRLNGGAALAAARGVSDSVCVLTPTPPSTRRALHELEQHVVRIAHDRDIEARHDLPLARRRS
jgi:hypothetical protein